MSNSLRVVWINELASPVGGAERYVAATAEQLRAAGVRSTLLYEVSSPVSAEMTRAFDGAFPIVDLERQLAALGPDVVFAHQIRDSRLVPALARTGLPILRFFHDHKLFCLREGKYTSLGLATCTRTVGPACYPCLGFVRRSDSWPGLRLIGVGRLKSEQRANMAFRGFVVGSRYMADHVAAHGFDRGRIHVVPLWVPPPPPPTNVGREQGLLLTVGQLIRGKGVDVLLRAMKVTTRPSRLAVAGTGRLEADWRALAGELGLRDRVMFLGPLAPDDLAGWYRKASCVVLPTRAPETFGLVGVEAMSHALPVIASRVGAIPEWLDHGETGLLVPPNDPSALARAIDEVLADPERAREMGEHGRAVHRRRYLPEHHVGRLTELLHAFSRRDRSS